MSAGLDKERNPSTGDAPTVQKESKQDRMLRYQAQVIAKRYNKSLSDARAIAEHEWKQKEKDDQRAANTRRREKRVRAEQQHERRKKGEHPYPLHGPPMQGGLPGGGRRR